MIIPTRLYGNKKNAQLALGRDVKDERQLAGCLRNPNEGEAEGRKGAPTRHELCMQAVKYFIHSSAWFVLAQLNEE